MNINESQNRDEQCTDKENENEFDLSLALSEESNNQKSADKKKKKIGPMKKFKSKKTMWAEFRKNCRKI